MLIGTYNSNLTSGKRVAIPAKFRAEIGEKMVIARWYEKCLVMVSETAWGELLQKITGKSEFVTAPVRDTDRFIMGSAYEFSVDAQGRVVLPETLLKYAGLTSEVLFIGLSDRVEIWDKVEWEKREQYIAEHADELMEKVANEQK
ncbi:division/cell wall cluster transcriptional repressor MraZ [candidate division WWE3 bacterium RIFOXYC1_FULL_39_7]|uniref:Transcriptional regulator MraZ n=1 Tax=candidate division WWE3 bacterium RIFOXYC1_FULL_39_7 TaxID=1802643 RepID=A0A1F4WJI8_UNCKA|nr:MAG: division/cell wall cluster transcriptional repressor MraZ [candidate division WWE3 bacterium RIFOXYC1_FULL_39_7]